MKINILRDFSSVDRHAWATKDQAGKVRGTRNARASKPQLRLLPQPYVTRETHPFASQGLFPPYKMGAGP